MARDSEKRVIKPPQRLDYADLITFILFSSIKVLNEELKEYEESIRSWNNIKLLKAMDDEMESLHYINTWELIEKPAGAMIVRCKWIFKVKEEIKGVIWKIFKARLIYMGFT